LQIFHTLVIIEVHKIYGKQEYTMANQCFDQKQESLEPEQEPSDKNELFHWILTLAIAVIIALCVNRFVLVNAEIPSGSMENTIMTGDRVFGNRLAYIFGEPKRFDIIIFRYPDDEKQLFIKRIIGLPGETVEIHDGQIFIDGSKTPLKDVTTKEFMQGSFGPYTVPDNCYFVMGDNRNNSKDSRYWEHTFVTDDEIVGKAFLRYWPLNKIKFL
jgi:signal peptidase I